jgi:hypothetical protein
LGAILVLLGFLLSVSGSLSKLVILFGSTSIPIWELISLLGMAMALTPAWDKKFEA